jgi:hypothetical protein
MVGRPAGAPTVLERHEPMAQERVQEVPPLPARILQRIVPSYLAVERAGAFGKKWHSLARRLW